MVQASPLCGLGRGPVPRQGCPCRPGRALGLGGRGSPSWEGLTAAPSLARTDQDRELLRWHPAAGAESLGGCGGPRRAAGPLPHAAVLRRLHGAPEGRPWVWASGGGDSLIRHSHNSLSTSNGGLRPHVGRGQKSSGLMTRLGARGHSSQLSGGRGPRGCAELGGLTPWKTGPLEVGAETGRQSGEGGDVPAPRFGAGAIGTEGSDALARSLWRST